MIGTYYYDPFSKSMRIAHLLGCLFATGTLVGLWIQRIDNDYEYIWIPGALTGIFVITYGIFWFGPRNVSDDPNKVTRNSKILIIFEAIAFTAITVSAGIFFIMYDGI
mmetsp:Transcript_2587/g.2194  ORF Transcript_2587/g.2194 Transcript_2587/m.2194 type:complete len:108 (+) Transcript_2587:40-363(+)